MCWGKYRKVQNFFYPNLEKEIIKIDKDGNWSVVTISYQKKFIDARGFMTTSLSNIVDNLTEGLQKMMCKDCEWFLENESVKDNSTKYKHLSCSEDYSNKIYEELKKM